MREDRLRTGVDQHPEAQHDALLAAGCDKVFLDKASGKLARRPELAKALHSANRTGDQLVVTKLDRLGRSLEHLIELSNDLRIGSGATVEATVHAKNVLVEGSLTGDLSADHKVELVAGAKVDGNIRAPKIVVAEGARFRGAVDMGSEPPKHE